jgi:hypothetical protein
MSIANRIFRTVLQLALLSLSPFLLFSQSLDETLPSKVQQPPYGGCAAPSHAGVNVCAPARYDDGASFIDSPFQVIATGTSAEGQVKLMEVWADGKKITQAAGDLFDAPINLEMGNHELTVVELDTTGAYLKSTRFEVMVNSDDSTPCSPPSSPGVNVCVPASGNCFTSPFATVFAAGTGASGTVKRMELWDDGVKIANFPGNYIGTNIYLSLYSKMTIVEVDSKGAYIKSAPILVQPC